MPKIREKVIVEFGLSVRRAREAKGWTQDQLCEAADLNQAYISGVERGERNPTILSASRIAKALGLTLSELCEGEGQ
jgi:transcriptional regulator with XRE-family HTH domain